MNVNQQPPMASPYGQPQPGYGQPSYAPLGGGYPGPYGPYSGPATAYQPGAPPQGYSTYASFPSKAVAANPVSDLPSPLDLGSARGPPPVSTNQAYSQYAQGDLQNGPPPMAQPAHRPPASQPYSQGAMNLSGPHPSYPQQYGVQPSMQQVTNQMSGMQVGSGPLTSAGPGYAPPPSSQPPISAAYSAAAPPSYTQAPPPVSGAPSQLPPPSEPVAPLPYYGGPPPSQQQPFPSSAPLPSQPFPSSPYSGPPPSSQPRAPAVSRQQSFPPGPPPPAQQTFPNSAPPPVSQALYSGPPPSSQPGPFPPTFAPPA
uniref:SEC24 homolog C, COPII coat complex component n=1 Tax=Hucho hucho TaxID=62062 RepID=A0A4W5NL17_9TELE